MKSVLRRVKIIGYPISRVAALDAGFRYAYLRRFQGYPFDAPSLEELATRGELTDASKEALALADSMGLRFAPDQRFVNKKVLGDYRASLDAFLVNLGSSLVGLESIQDYGHRYNVLRKHVGAVSKAHDAWLRAGVGIFVNTALLGFDLVASTNEEGRAVMTRDDVRNTGVLLTTALEDLEWSPDRIESFFLEKVVPHLHEPGLRRWVFAPNMAVMSDLRALASEADKANAVATCEERVVGAIKAILEGVPFVGKAIAVLVFGEKKK